MNFEEAKYHARHNMTTHKYMLVTESGCIHLSNEPIKVEGHLVKDNGTIVKEEVKEHKHKK